MMRFGARAAAASGWRADMARKPAGAHSRGGPAQAGDRQRQPAARPSRQGGWSETAGSRVIRWTPLPWWRRRLTGIQALLVTAATFLAVFLGGVFGPDMLKSHWVAALKASAPQVALAPYYRT